VNAAPQSSRRAFLKCAGLTAAALAGSRPLELARAARSDGSRLLAPRQAHFPPKADNLIFIFLTGGFSHVDTFDPKPALARDAGKVVTGVHLRGADPLPLMPSPFKFTRQGQSGLPISELFPRLGARADDLCILRGLHTDIVEHFQAVLAMHTGSATVPMPSLGAWLSYGLGSLNPNLPTFVALVEHLPYAGSQVWDSNFLPPEHQATRVIPGAKPISDLDNAQPTTLQAIEQSMLDRLNERHAELRGNDPALRARIASNQTARGLMREAPEVFDLSGETNATLSQYGLDRGDQQSFAAQCLIARRMLERGVRVVEVIDTGMQDNWDAHGDMQQHRPKAARVDRGLAGLITDLKGRGLFSRTLVAICTEFGRTPWTDGPGHKGRNHYARAFSAILAGAGVKGGMTHGATDEYGIEIVEHPMHIHDYHATILHLMGIDHTRLTYRHAGRDFRLTDVAGEVAHAILA
jgi:Protein of unknown function (DUF1501)